ncbi:MAG TPA: phosphate ABC transporter substrate-binding protein, partial [Micromonosporaceae bacterium]
MRPAAVVIAVTLALTVGAQPADAATYVPISGAGSTWSYNALHAWQGNVAQYGMRINYIPVG